MSKSALARLQEIVDDIDTEISDLKDQVEKLTEELATEEKGGEELLNENEALREEVMSLKAKIEEMEGAQS